MTTMDCAEDIVELKNLPSVAGIHICREVLLGNKGRSKF